MPAMFAAVFTSDPEVLRIATRALTFIAPAFGAFGLGMALYFASMGAGRMAWPVGGALARIGLAVGGGWLLADVMASASTANSQRWLPASPPMAW